jgi:hypothetical protein
MGEYGSSYLTCTPNVVPPERDIAASRKLSQEDIKTLRALIEGSDLYGGGHTGFGERGSEGPHETLTVMCCGRQDLIVLVTRGNQTFESGTRRELLDLLYKWQGELRQEAERERRKR